jgi:hypothetical protein
VPFTLGFAVEKNGYVPGLRLCDEYSTKDSGLIVPVLNSFPNNGSSGPMPFVSECGVVLLFSIITSSPVLIVTFCGRKTVFPCLSSEINITAVTTLVSVSRCVMLAEVLVIKEDLESEKIYIL